MSQGEGLRWVVVVSDGQEISEVYGPFDRARAEQVVEDRNDMPAPKTRASDRQMRALLREWWDDQGHFEDGKWVPHDDEWKDGPPAEPVDDWKPDPERDPTFELCSKDAPGAVKVWKVETGL